MKIRHFFMAALVILIGFVNGFGLQDKVYTINVQVFEIPPIQTITQAGPDKNGVVVGTTVGGDVTAKFPAQPVFIQTDLGPGAADEEVKNILYDGKFLPRNCLPDGVRWTLAGSYSISCPERDLGMNSGRKEYHEPPIAPSSANHFVRRGEYRLTILPVSANSGKATLSLKFTGKIKSAENDAGFDKILLDQDVKITLGKTALVGFPQFTTEGLMSTPRGTVYILAVLVQKIR
ncbi:MAG: hypothetical protein ACXVI6_02160 [Candidatus Aminicenantales bacterium]